MDTVAVVGAGEVGGACVRALALGRRVNRILLIDDAREAAAGKALDITQSGAVQPFHVELIGTGDRYRAAGCDVCVIADRFGNGSPEWQLDLGLSLVKELDAVTGGAPLVFAGTAQTPLLAAAREEAGVERGRIVGSASEAFRSAIAAIVALDAGCAPGDVSLTVLGSPAAAFVVPWSGASVAGCPVEGSISQARLARINRRVASLWPPGAYALGTAAARVAEGMIVSARRPYNVLTVLDGEFGARRRVGAVLARLGPRGIAETWEPSLSTRERVQVETVLGA